MPVRVVARLAGIWTLFVLTWALASHAEDVGRPDTPSRGPTIALTEGRAARPDAPIPPGTAGSSTSAADISSAFLAKDEKLPAWPADHDSDNRRPRAGNKGGSEAPQGRAARGKGPRTAARGPSGPALASPDGLLAAQLCWVESGFSLRDCAAEVYVIRRRARRAGWPFARMALAYSALDARTGRAMYARSLPDGDAVEWSAKTNRRWAQLRRVAAAALEGRARNPVPGATDWCSRTHRKDRARAARAIESGRLRMLPTDTLNAFFAEVR